MSELEPYTILEIRREGWAEDTSYRVVNSNPDESKWVTPYDVTPASALLHIGDSVTLVDFTNGTA